MRIGLAADGSRVERLEVARLDGKRHVARARTFVLAVGGIENARLLLASDDVRPAGVGNDHDLVGRFFQAHMTYSVDGDEESEGSAVHVSRAAPMTLYARRPAPRPIRCWRRARRPSRG